MKKTTYAKALPKEFPTLEQFKAGIHRAAEKVRERRAMVRIAKQENVKLEELAEENN